MSQSPYLIQQPQQARSRKTMNQILNAAAKILEIKNFQDLTIAEVVQQANTSVGAFYGRFKDKEALLQALDERFFQEFEEAVNTLLAPTHWQDKSIAYIVEDVTRLIAHTYSKDRGVIRSLNLKARLHGDSHFMSREQRAWNVLYPRFQEILLSRRDKISHPNPALAIQLGFKQMFYCMREILLWESLRGDTPYDHEELVLELTRTYLAYLGVLKAH